MFLSLVLPAYSQADFEITSLEGTARVQRNQRGAWETLRAGDRLGDNDLVESLFQTRLTIRFNELDMAILGSNSKALLNVDNQQEISEINITVFEGGVFTRTNSDALIRVYTANAVSEIEDGALSTLTESQAGETGIQVLEGRATIRNIAQQRTVILQRGFTSMVLQNREPTAPLYMTTRHLTVLEHFFGEQYISSLVEAAGIDPTDDQAPRERRAAEKKLEPYVDEGMDNYIFSINSIWGSILKEKYGNHSFWSSIENTPPKRTTSFGVKTAVRAGDGAVSPSVFLTAHHSFSNFYTGIRIGMLKNAQGQFIFGPTSMEGIIDMVDHITFSSKNTSIQLGSFSDLTVSSGFIVRNFNSNNYNSLFRDAGLVIQHRRNPDLFLTTFLQNVLAPEVGAVHLSLKPSVYNFGFGYYFDLNQSSEPSEENQTYNTSQLTATDDLNEPSVHIVGVGFEGELFSDYNFAFGTTVEYGHLLGSYEGFIVKVPSFFLNLNRIHAAAGIITESGQFVTEQFGRSYMRQRTMFQSADSGNSLSLQTPNSILSEERNTQGFFLDFRINPTPGTSFQAYFKRDYKTENSFNVIDTTQEETKNFSFDLSFTFDETFLPFISNGIIYVTQANGALYPPNGSFFSSLSFESGFEITTLPLFFNCLLTAAAKFYFSDQSSDLQKFGDTNSVFEVQIGITHKL
ncbi:hypothetical protein QA601_06525 [Chitinispirillales bacterium ANBcel5]|uniref:hypothetical protein n=1 Tax=Cellulosispirillum alkaliphilum TaxID=3039283 RepID=UPI002A4F74A3|nr:hypothetical protein [Chitinispirillales bacterium ANBcel5]